ncbi:M28 family peptidase [Hymenobacter algoricola]|uniref:Peptidase M28 domain-containing protein n=1 Tax=Hymenobacter algoricola TaxID=486267 RepID=A0ABP7NM48_9BACT
MPFRSFVLTILLCAVLGPARAAGADTVRLRRHLLALTTTPEPRNYRHLTSLNQAADYIRQELQTAGARLTEQPYVVQGNTYRNVIGSFGPQTGPRLITGVHYGVCGEQPGADDNGTGVAALLELARLLGQPSTLPCRIDLVAYTLEEPPFFRTKSMGATYMPGRCTTKKWS